MSRTGFHVLVFLVGLLAVCWIGFGYVATHPLGAAVAAVIAACYIAGGVELLRYRQGTTALRGALADLSAAQDSLAAWLERVPVGLRNAVRLRVEGERTALPGPVLTPYLVGLLVLLGMLGTLLGMMATLRGTGLALESATDLQAIRGSLASPVQGLAVAFGTSIAGVASSAMLGLLSALLRRDRLLVVQQLDRAIGAELRPYTQVWQRDESLRLMQAQAAALPALVERLQAMTAAFEQHSSTANERLLAGQSAFLDRTETLQTRLAETLQQSLREGVDASARAVGSTLQPLAETTLAGLAAQGKALHTQVEQAVQRQLDGLTTGFEHSRKATEASWQQALRDQRDIQQTLMTELRAHLEGFGTQQAQHADALLDTLSQRLQADAAANAQAWQASTAQAGDALAATSRHLDERAQALVQVIGERHEALQTQLRDDDARRQQAWQQAREQAQQAHAEVLATLENAGQQRQAHWDAALAALEEAHRERSTQFDAADAQRLQQWAATLQHVSAALGDQLQATSAQLAVQQQSVCDALARTAREIGDNGRTQANETLGEVRRLLQTAAEAPKAAADVVAELRANLSESLARDNAVLEERGRLLQTVQTLLEAVNHAATEQRGAVDALVGTSADLLERVGTRFTDHIAAETGKLDGIAAQLSGSAGSVGELAAAFGSAVQQFGSASEGLSERLQVIGSALDASLARSDEQLAYYVSQAREVVDLSLLSQKQVLEELQQLAAKRGKAGSA